MPLMRLSFPANGEKLLWYVANVVALGNGDMARTRTLLDGFFAELTGVELDAIVQFNRSYGEIIEIDDAVFKFTWLTERRNTDALTDFRAAEKSDQFQRDKPYNLAVAHVAQILLEAIHDGTGLGLNRALQEAADRLAAAGREISPPSRLSYLSRNTIRKYWLERRGIAHLLMGLIEVDMGKISIVEFPHFCESARNSLSANGPRRARAGSVYVPESEQISIVCGDADAIRELTSK